MSIASRTNAEFHDDDFSKGLLLMEATLTEHSAGVIIGERPDAARELARLLLIIERGIASLQTADIKKAVNTVDLLVEFAYLESKEYGRSLQDWRSELCDPGIPEPSQASNEEIPD